MIDFKDKDLNFAINSFVEEVKNILGNKIGMICLYGSIVYDDLSPYYGDLDFHCLLNSSLSQGEIDRLFEYRRKLKRSENIYFQMLEGEFAPVSLCDKSKTDNVAYWGTSREKVFHRISIRSFSLIGLIMRGIVIYGQDLRYKYPVPTRQEMLDDVFNMIKTVRTYALTTNEDIHSIDWLFLISQSLYWIFNDDVTSKSSAAKWAYNQNFRQWINCLPRTLELRKNPPLANLPENRAWLAGLGPDIQSACDDLERAVKGGERIRRAEPRDSVILTEIAVRSEAYWGYDSEFMKKFQSAYRVTEEFIRDNPTYVISENDNILGFYAVVIGSEETSLEYLFIEPGNIGKGLGRLLWNHMLETCESLGVKELTIVCGPQVKGFYKKLGAAQIGEVESLVLKGRWVPQLLYCFKK